MVSLGRRIGPTVAYLHANVGLTNGLSHLYAAQLAYSPVVVLNGIKPARSRRMRASPPAEDARPVHQYVKMDWQSLSADAIPDDVNRALRTAVTEPPGAGVGGAQPGPPQRPRPRWGCQMSRVPLRLSNVAAPAAVAHAVELLAAAQRPVLVAGSEVARSGAMRTLVKLSEQLNAAVLHEDRRGFERPGFPTDHPNFRGQYVR